MKTTNISKSLIIALSLLGSIFSSCTLDERLDDLKGGYEGAIINKNTGELIATEYYGAKLRFLDLAYGSVATPINYNILPDGSYRNTKVFPSKYKIWVEGPLLSQDTIYGDVSKNRKFNIYAIPNVDIKLISHELNFGIMLDITYCYQVNDPNSLEQSVGFVYSKNKFPGQKDALNEGQNAPTYKRITDKIKEKVDTITQRVMLQPNSTYYFRALAKTSNAANFWNYSNQLVVKTTDVDIASLPVQAKQGVTSAVSSVLQWDFPPVVDEIALTYTDADGLVVNDVFKPSAQSYVAGLPFNTESDITVQLRGKGTSGPEQIVKVKTKSLTDKYVPSAKNRPAHVPFYNDENFKWSLSSQWAAILGQTVAPAEGWDKNPSRYQFMDWWNTWLDGFADRQPSCQDILNFKTFTIYGDAKSLVDILGFANLETLRFSKGDIFSAGKTVDATLDLSPLVKLKNLKTVEIDPGVPLNEELFKKAGIDTQKVQIVKK